MDTKEVYLGENPFWLLLPSVLLNNQNTGGDSFSVLLFFPLLHIFVYNISWTNNLHLYCLLLRVYAPTYTNMYLFDMLVFYFILHFLCILTDSKMT